eukprot:SAG31_NODE_30140_length_385_cov_0.534965_1_plen_91_part_10
MGDEQFKQMCEEIDSDGDGAISYAEFRKYFMAGEDASGEIIASLSLQSPYFVRTLSNQCHGIALHRTQDSTKYSRESPHSDSGKHSVSPRH